MEGMLPSWSNVYPDLKVPVPQTSVCERPTWLPGVVMGPGLDTGG